ncbi:Protein N-methyltransferase NNT1 [Zalerion maritima]|uniref:Protein N-methyltransferase NNT1 n=1 Tax=Zalerion maritima TaxID=339359 RepID=A0AAD5RJF5_9PEZI|nr:Protein N-methyltransferase NNT1 [Zalerion maritima]
MALTSRISLQGPPDTSPEDFLASSLSVIFPDDATNQHGDARQTLVYTSPHLPKPLQLTLCDPTQEDRRLFSHFLWNSSLLLAELVECSTLSVPLSVPSHLPSPNSLTSSWNVADKSTIELGAGTALPSIVSALIGARRVVITDYPAPRVISNLKANVERCLAKEDPGSSSPSSSPTPSTVVECHAWGELDNDFALREKGSFDRVFACDCLWMPCQHDNLRRSIAHFLSDGPDARAWVIAGFHAGRENTRGFFGQDELAKVGLEVERIWERDCCGEEREWAWDRGLEDAAVRKRWLVIAILKRKLES